MTQATRGPGFRLGLLVLCVGVAVVASAEFRERGTCLVRPAEGSGMRINAGLVDRRSPLVVAFPGTAGTPYASVVRISARSGTGWREKWLMEGGWEGNVGKSHSVDDAPAYLDIGLLGGTVFRATLPGGIRSGVYRFSSGERWRVARLECK